MKRFTMIMALVLMVAMPTFAERVTSETAQKVATTFLNNNGAKSAHLTDLSKEAGFPNLYIFNAEQGFVVMSADDCVMPILGYSLTGSFITDNMPANVRDWLQGYNDEIQYAINNKMRASTETFQLWKDLAEGKDNVAKNTTVVAPLIQTKWNQNEYYNNLCPEVAEGPNGRAYTGCTATAMAQIMKYYNYPARGISSHSYEWNGQILSADFGATTYDWNNMTNYYYYYYDDNETFHWIGENSTEQEILAVATLMYHCGVSTNMNYSGSGSGASLFNAANALKNYFNYSSTTEFKHKSDYADTEWKTMVKNELNASRPLEYAGYNPNGAGGHAFVCDGYDNADYFHFNWGWAGHYNGYFSLSNLDTGANSSDPGAGNGVYTRDQEAIFGIKPSSNNATPTNLTYNLSGLQDITLNWTGASGATSYNVYRNDNLINNTTSNTFSEIAPFGTNVYYIRSVDTNGELSLPSNDITITVAYQIPIVDDLSATLSGNDVSLSWTAPEWCYPETPTATLNYGEGNLGYRWNSTYYGHRHFAADLVQYTGKAVYKVSTYIQYPGTYSLYIYTNASLYSNYYYVSDGDLAFSEEGVSVSISNDWYDFELTTPLILTGANDLWVIIKQENTGESFPVPSFDLSPHNINAFYRGFISNNTLYLTDGHPSYDCAWFINVYLTDGAYTYNLYDGTNSIASNIYETNYTDSNISNNAAHQYTVTTNYYGGETEASNKIGFAKGDASLPLLNINANDQMTITEGSTLTVSGALTNNDPTNLILENGAQLIHNSANVQATVKKDITSYTANLNNGWHLIASPVTESITPSTSNGLLTNDYDLYKFDQSQELEWRNYKANSFSTIDHKTGYLYANSSDLTLEFTGTLAASAEPTNLTYIANTELSGFNLIGNPYPCNTYVDRSFYVLNADGSDFTLGSNPISPCAAILVQAQGSGESVTFSKTASKNESNISISIAANTKGNAIIDQARVSFNENDQLMKYTLSDLSSKLYIPQNGQDFAVAFAANQTEMPVNFKATKDGTYTICVEAEDLELDYLHLIDNKTGADVDLLATPNYTFEAKTNDYESRFKLMFDENNGLSTSSEVFAYVNNGEIVITETCPNASLQIVDMTGRIIVNRDNAHTVSTIGMTPGVYVLRLINNEKVNTQKIVIK